MSSCQKGRVPNALPGGVFALATAGWATSAHRHVIAAVRLLILTGARLREILDLKWSHVDLERGLLLLPNSKTGQ